MIEKSYEIKDIISYDHSDVSMQLNKLYKLLIISKSSILIYGEKEKRTDSLTSLISKPIAFNTCEGFVLLHADPEEAAITGDKFFNNIWLLIPLNLTFIIPGILLVESELNIMLS